MTIEILELTTTTETAEQAQALANQLVNERLAACVQIERIHSVYHWQGKLCDSPEFRCTAKTTPELEAAVLECIRQQHPYEVPEILLKPARVSDDYGQWLLAQVGDAEVS